jgi:hypothetical protein
MFEGYAVFLYNQLLLIKKLKTKTLSTHQQKRSYPSLMKTISDFYFYFLNKCQTLIKFFFDKSIEFISKSTNLKGAPSNYTKGITKSA